jgi:DNA-binding GntR family transcriptional regulator
VAGEVREVAIEPVTAAPGKSQLAYDWIKARITAGAYRPGYRLVLAPIAKELGVSVVPVREAIRRLEAEGLVSFERNVGGRVAMVDESVYRHTMQTLAVVEGFATALAAPLLTAEQLSRARAVNQRLAACLAEFDPHRFTELNHEFHAALFEPCPNPHLLGLVHRGWDRLNALRDSTFSFVPGRAAESVKEHEQLLTLVASGAPASEVELAARQHRLATLTAFRDHRAACRRPTS